MDKVLRVGVAAGPFREAASGPALQPGEMSRKKQLQRVLVAAAEPLDQLKGGLGLAGGRRGRFVGVIRFGRLLRKPASVGGDSSAVGPYGPFGVFVSKNPAGIVSACKGTILSATRLDLADDPGGVVSDLPARLRKRFGLTPAEARVAIILADGLSYTEIAQRLSVSTHTVHTHIKEIHQKLGVHTNGRAAAVIRSMSYQK